MIETLKQNKRTNSQFLVKKKKKEHLEEIEVP